MTLEEMLAEDNRRMRQAGCELAEAALHVIRTYDGIHRLSLAVSGWAIAVACEGGRGQPSARQRRANGTDHDDIPAP